MSQDTAQTTQTGYDRNMKGALFSNKNRASDKHPHYNGSVVIDDVKYWLAGWKRESRAGVTYLGLSVTRDTKQDEEPARSDIPSDVQPQLSDDDIPF